MVGDRDGVKTSRLSGLHHLTEQRAEGARPASPVDLGDMKRELHPAPDSPTNGRSLAKSAMLGGAWRAQTPITLSIRPPPSQVIADAELITNCNDTKL